MKRLIIAAATTLAFVGAPIAQERVEIGRLQCDVEGGFGLIIGSSKDVVCSYFDASQDEPIETYVGEINKFGLDIGVTEDKVIQWLVLAPKSDAYAAGVLAGQYIGVSAEATVGVGVGANALVGGSGESFTLQPLSVQGQTGLNLAAGITGFQLRSADQ